MICPYCGAATDETDKFCNLCRKPLLTFLTQKESPLEKSLQPYSYYQEETDTNEYTHIIQDEEIESKIKDINKLLEEKQAIGEPNGDLLLKKASLYYKKRDLNTSSKILEIALNDFKNENDTMSAVICHNEIGLIKEELGFFDNSIYHFDRAIDLLQEIRDLPKLIKLYNNIANVYFLIKDLEQSYEYYQKAIKLARQENLIMEEVKSSSNLVDVLFFLKDFDTISKILDRNAFLFNQTGDINGTINTLIKYGKLNYHLGIDNHEKSFKQLNEALDLIGKISSQVSLHIKAQMEWECNYYLGRLHSESHQYDKAENHLLQALESLRIFEIDESNSQEMVLEAFAQLFQNKGQFKKAIEYYDLAGEISYKFGDDTNLAEIKIKIGEINLNFVKNDSEAIRYYEEALEIFEKLNFEKNSAEILHKLGDIYINKNNINLALKNFERAKFLYKDLQDEYNINLIDEKKRSLDE